MSGQRFKAFVVGLLLAIILSIVSPVPAAPAIVLAGECDSTASGCP